MSNLPFRPPVKTSHCPSGDQPCKYDGASEVIGFGVPPVAGSVKISDCPPWLALMPSILPSKDSTWSLLHLSVASVARLDVCFVAKSKRKSWPEPAARPLRL